MAKPGRRERAGGNGPSRAPIQTVSESEPGSVDAGVVDPEALDLDSCLRSSAGCALQGPRSCASGGAPETASLRSKMRTALRGSPARRPRVFGVGPGELARTASSRAVSAVKPCGAATAASSSGSETFFPGGSGLEQRARQRGCLPLASAWRSRVWARTVGKSRGCLERSSASPPRARPPRSWRRAPSDRARCACAASGMIPSAGARGAAGRAGPPPRVCPPRGEDALEAHAADEAPGTDDVGVDLDADHHFAPAWVNSGRYLP